MLLLTFTLFLFAYNSEMSMAVKTDYLVSHCGGNIVLSHEHAGTMELHLTPESEYLANTNCYVTLSVESPMRIHLIFLKMGINSFHHCPGDFLEIFDGLSEVTDKSFYFNDQVGLKYCGDKIPKAVTSEYNNLTLRFVSDGSFHGRGFSMLLTAFHEGHCKDDEYRCSNSRCIHESLHCDAYDHCGDDSDSCPFSIFLIVGYVLTAFISTIAVVFLGIVLRYRCSKDVQDGSYDYYIDDVLPPLRQLSHDPGDGPSTDIFTVDLSLSSVSVITSENTQPEPDTVDAVE